MRRALIAVLSLVVGFGSASASAQAPPCWLTLPPTPSLPTPQATGMAPINGVSIWYAVFGIGPPIVLLHGSLANSNYWGHQVPILAQTHQNIVMDSRGHGRSTCNAQAFGYDLMASDVVGLLDHLGIAKSAMWAGATGRSSASISR